MSENNIKIEAENISRKFMKQLTPDYIKIFPLNSMCGEIDPRDIINFSDVKDHIHGFDAMDNPMQQKVINKMLCFGLNIRFNDGTILMNHRRRGGCCE